MKRTAKPQMTAPWNLAVSEAVIGEIVQRTELVRRRHLPPTYAVEQFGTGMHIELLVNMPLVSKRRPFGNAKLFLNSGNVIAAREYSKHITFAWSKTALICNESAVTGQGIYFIGQIISRNNGISCGSLSHAQCPVDPVMAKTQGAVQHKRKRYESNDHRRDARNKHERTFKGRPSHQISQRSTRSTSSNQSHHKRQTTNSRTAPVPKRKSRQCRRQNRNRRPQGKRRDRESKLKREVTPSMHGIKRNNKQGRNGPTGYKWVPRAAQPVH